MKKFIFQDDIVLLNKMILKFIHYSCVIDSPFGKIGIITQNDKLTHLELLIEQTSLKTPSDPISKTIVSELQQYFDNPQYNFTVKLLLNGSSFQKKVWCAVREIPCGKTMSYGQLAKQLQTSPRAIGQACRTNPIPIIIPCHRIVAANHLGGYSGQYYGKMISIKHHLLHHEGYL